MQSVQLGRKIGEGIFGTVYECTWNGHGTTKYAIKVSNTDAVNSYIQKEDGILRYLHRGPNATEQNIIRRYGIERLNSGEIGIVLELLGLNLRDFLSSQCNQGWGLPLKRMQQLVIQLGRALSFVHEAGIIHADIKPENILLSRDFTVIKLADFGIASYQEIAHHPEGHVQSLEYRSPEVILECEYGTAIDVWAFAVVIAEVYMKKRVFGLQSIAERELIACHHKRLGKVYPKDFVERGSNLGQDIFINSFEVSVPIIKTLSELLHETALFRQPLEKKNDLFFDLIDKMFVFDPEKRIKAAEISDHPFLKDSITLLIESIHEGSGKATKNKIAVL